MLAATPFAFLGGLHDPANLPQSAFLQAAALALLAARVAQGTPFGRTALDRPILAFAAWSALSVLWAQDRGPAIPAAIHVAAAASWFFLVSRVVPGPAAARRILAAVFLSGLAVALLGLAQHLFGLAVVYQAVPPAATFVHKNIAAQYAAATLPLALALADRARPWTLLASGLGAGILLVFVAATRTRSAAFALVLAGLVVARSAWGQSRWFRGAAVPVAAAGLIVAGLALAGLAFPRLGARLDALRLHAPAAAQPEPPFTSIHHRQAIWANTVEMARRERPAIGLGIGQFAIRYPAYARTAAADRAMSARNQPDHAHNDYLQVLAETGLVGTGLGAWALAAAWLAWSRGKGRAPDRLSLALAGAGGVVLADALFSFPLQRALPPFLLATVAGMVAARDPATSAPAAAERARGRQRAIAVVLAASALGVAVWSVSRIRASAHLLAALSAERRADWRAVRAHVAEVLRRDGSEPLALLAGGRAELASGRPHGALVLFRRAAALRPHHIPVLGSLAVAEAQAGDPLRALETFARVLALDPGDARAHFGRGEILEARGAAWPALHAYRMAVAHDRLSAAYQYGRGRAAARVGSYPEAVTALRAATTISPRGADAHKLLGVVLHDALGRRDEGRRHIEEALRLRPDDPEAALWRARLPAKR